MTEGLIAELPELINLKRFAHRVHYKPENQRQRAGNHLSRIRGRGMDFSEVRHYQAGDEIRHMEWRVTARTGRPHIKVYQEEKERPVVILTDFSPSMYFGTRIAFKSVIAARLAALIAWTAIKQGDRVGGLFYSLDNHSEFIPRGRESGVLPLLASLSDYTRQYIHKEKADSVVSLSDELLRLRRVAKPGSMLVLISDFYQMNQECEKHLNRLRAHNDILAYHVCDILELAPPKPALYAITDGKREMMLDTMNPQVWNDYQAFCENQRLNLQAQFKRLQIQYTQITAEADLAELVRRTFPGRSRG
ncbi:MAG: DUF58 domain-containing protein [Legionella sp.]|nr:DUF58 domain-containing protein [Legionella sp.]